MPDTPRAGVLQGTLDLMILQTLATMGPQHGYGIAARLEQVSGGALQLNMGTLYPGADPARRPAADHRQVAADGDEPAGAFLRADVEGTDRAGTGARRLGADGGHHGARTGVTRCATGCGERPRCCGAGGERPKRARRCSFTSTWRSRKGCGRGCRPRRHAGGHGCGRYLSERRRVGARRARLPLAGRVVGGHAPCGPRAVPQPRLRRRQPPRPCRHRRDQHRHLLHARRRRPAAAALRGAPTAGAALRRGHADAQVPDVDRALPGLPRERAIARRPRALYRPRHGAERDVGRIAAPDRCRRHIRVLPGPRPRADAGPPVRGVGPAARRQARDRRCPLVARVPSGAMRASSARP